MIRQALPCAQVLMSDKNPFNEAIRGQIAANLARTPSDRFMSLCELLDLAREMAPRDPISQERRSRALRARSLQQEQRHADFRRFIATQRANASQSV